MIAAADTVGGAQQRAAVDLLQTALGANGTIAAEVLASVANAVGGCDRLVLMQWVPVG